MGVTAAPPVSEGLAAIVIVFDGKVSREDLNDFSVQLLREQPESQQSRTRCWCQVIAEYDLGDTATKCKTDGFVGSGAPFVTAVRVRPVEFAKGRYRVVVHGDLIRDSNKKAVDANHLPPWLNAAGKTGDGIQGGTFHSQFEVKG
jgi:hypothetical protein